jgi:(R,R)-butanediol dehydrogenase / meso-butanediol dehydrogenase / diacetyl reductase
MRALQYQSPGDLRVVDLPAPSASQDAVLAPVYVGICGTDLSIAAGGFARVKPPVTLGHEFIARIVDLPAAASAGDTLASSLEVGQLVFVNPLISCGSCTTCTSGLEHICEKLGLYGIDRDGGLAEQVSIPVSNLVALPDDADPLAFALTEPVSVAAHMIRRSGAGASSNILIVGGGPIGILVAETLRAGGHAKVLVAEPNPQRQALISILGFEVRGDLSAENVDSGYDVVFELTGIEAGLEIAVAAARPGATVLLGGLPHHPVAFAAALAAMKELSIVGSRVYQPQDIQRAIELIGQGAIRASQLVTSVVKFEDAISQGFDKLKNSRDEMKILIEVGA